MITKEGFELIRQKHGGYSSWAIWAKVTDKPKSNMADMSVFDVSRNDSLFQLLNPKVMMIGLNISRSFEEPFKNFHDANPRANDFKIRFAFEETEYYGAYMTDVIKNFEMVDSGDVKKYLKDNPKIVKENLGLLRKEMADLKSEKPVILAFGGMVHQILTENLETGEYKRLIKLTHYSHQIGKEEYRKKVQEEISLAYS
jgi:hypothetical protein